MFRIVFKYGVVVLALLMSPPGATAQNLGERILDEIVEEGRARVGGILRDRVVPREGNNPQGFEEGMPPLREGGNERLAPNIVAPDRVRWRLGVNAYNTDTGVVVTQVIAGSSAARIGLEPGDRIVAVNGFQIGWIHDRVYPLSAELQRQADSHGHVTLLLQNVRNARLLVREAHLDRWRSR